MNVIIKIKMGFNFKLLEVMLKLKLILPFIFEEQLFFAI